MKLHLYSSSKSSHSGYVSCALWITNELLVTCGDDQKLLFWNILAYSEPIKTVLLPFNAFPTSMHYHNSAQQSSSSAESIILISNVKIYSTSNQIAIGATNGCFYLLPINWNGAKFDRTFEAHKGAIIVIRWSNDNSTLATAGEDGLVKIWSKIGMLRSTIQVSNTLPVYALSWSPDSNSLVYVNNANLIIKSLSPQSKTLEWIAHEGLIISVHWSPINNRILTAAEDGRVKIWDTNGRMIYVSGKHLSALTSIAWSSDGELFVVSTFNSLKLHDQLGHCLSVEKLLMEGLVFVSWSPNVQQVCCACSSGRVLFAYVVNRVLESKFWQVTNTSRRTLKVTNSTNDFQEMLEFKDQIIKFSFQFEHLIVATKSQCFIYQVNNLATPHYFEIKQDVCALMVKQSHKCFALINLNGANLYSYDGRFLKTIKLFNIRPECLLPNYLSLNDFTLAYKDTVNVQTVHFIDLENHAKMKDSSGQGQSLNQYRHQLEIINVKLNTEHRNYLHHRNNGSIHQLCAILDQNSDLYILSWNNSANNSMKQLRSFKLSPMIRDICWHVDYNLLVSLHENRKNLSVWLYLNAVFLDSSLLQDLVLVITNQEISSKGRVVEFSQNRITIERQDRLKIYLTINPFVILLHKHKNENRLDEAVRMCNFLDRSINEIEPVEQNVRNSLWATLAVMSLEEKQFRIAEVSYAAINKLDKVLYLNFIKTLPSQELITAELELLCGNFDLAEHLFIQKSYILRAIQLNLQLQHWTRALELAQKFNSRFSPFRVPYHSIVQDYKGQENFLDNNDGECPGEIKVDLIHMVLSCRENYLRRKHQTKVEENLEQFQKLNEIDCLADWNEINKILQQDLFVYNRN